MINTSQVFHWAEWERIGRPTDR